MKYWSHSVKLNVRSWGDTLLKFECESGWVFVVFVGWVAATDQKTDSQCNAMQCNGVSNFPNCFAEWFQPQISAWLTLTFLQHQKDWSNEPHCSSSGFNWTEAFSVLGILIKINIAESSKSDATFADFNKSRLIKIASSGPSGPWKLPNLKPSHMYCIPYFQETWI